MDCIGDDFVASCRLIWKSLEMSGGYTGFYRGGVVMVSAVTCVSLLLRRKVYRASKHVAGFRHRVWILMSVDDCLQVNELGDKRRERSAVFSFCGLLIFFRYSMYIYVLIFLLFACWWWVGPAAVLA